VHPQDATYNSAIRQHVEIVSFHSPEGRETEARFRISEGTLSLAPFAHDQPLALFGAEIEFRHSSDFDRLLIWRFNGSDVLPRFLMSDTRQLHSLGGGGLLARVLARGHGGNMSAPQGECESAPCLIAGAGGGFGAISMRCSGKGGSLRYVANNGSSWLELSVGSSARAQS
jgi:hypothetical protein